MAVSLSREQLQLFDRLSRIPDGQMLAAIVKTWQADVDKTLRHASGEALLRAQGEAQRLEELADLLTGGAAARIQATQRTLRPVAQALI